MQERRKKPTLMLGLLRRPNATDKNGYWGEPVATSERLHRSQIFPLSRVKKIENFLAMLRREISTVRSKGKFK